MAPPCEPARDLLCAGALLGPAATMVVTQAALISDATQAVEKHPGEREGNTHTGWWDMLLDCSRQQW